MNVTLILSQSDLPITASQKLYIGCFGGVPSPPPGTISCDIPEDENCSNDDLYYDDNPELPRYSIEGTVDSGGKVVTDGVVTRKSDAQIKNLTAYKDVKRKEKILKMRDKHMRKLALAAVKANETLTAEEDAEVDSQIADLDNE